MTGFRWLSPKFTNRYYLSQTISWAKEQSTINANHLLRAVHLFADHAARARTAGVMTRIPSSSMKSHLLLTGRRTTLATKTTSKIRTNITKKQNYETRHNLDSIQFVANFKFSHLFFNFAYRLCPFSLKLLLLLIWWIWGESIEPVWLVGSKGPPHL